jgi:hypothetical protein
MRVFRAAGDKGGAGEKDGSRKGNPFLGLFVIMLTLALAGLSYSSWSKGASRGESAALEKAAAAIGDGYSPLRLGLLKEASGGIRIRAKLLDRDGKELCVLERSLPGSSVAVDFRLLPVGATSSRRWLAFPLRAYSDATAPDSGLALLEAGDRAGFPAVFEGLGGGQALDAASRKALTRARAAIGKAGQEGGQRYTILIPLLSDGAVYDIVMGVSGGARLRPVAAF